MSRLLINAFFYGKRGLFFQLLPSWERLSLLQIKPQLRRSKPSCKPRPCTLSCVLPPSGCSGVPGERGHPEGGGVEPGPLSQGAAAVPRHSPTWSGCSFSGRPWRRDGFVTVLTSRWSPPRAAAPMLEGTVVEELPLLGGAQVHGSGPRSCGASTSLPGSDADEAGERPSGI